MRFGYFQELLRRDLAIARREQKFVTLLCFEIVEPVHVCQTTVRVTGQVKGGLVEIWSAVRGMIGWRHSMGSESTVRVSALLENEPIEAHAVSCAGQEGSSPVARATRATDVPVASATLAI